jgi:hypothetical protein
MGRAPAKVEEPKLPATTGGAQLPAYLQQHQGSGSGLKGLDMSDIIVPRIKLMQATSEEITAFDDAKVGQFWLNVLDQPLGPKFDFIPISNRKRYLLSVPLGGTPSGILARADDGVHWSPASGEWQVTLPNERKPVTWKIEGDGTVRGSGLAEFGTSKPEDPASNPAATLFYDYLVYLPDFPDISPVVLSLSRTAAKRARDLNGKIEFAKAPMQGLRFTTGVSSENAGPNRDYYNYTFSRNGFATEEEFNGCQALANRFKDYRGADEEGELREAAGGSDVDHAKARAETEI